MTQQQTPRLRLDFYNTAVLMTRWQENGRIFSYPVSVHDVVTACTDVELSSGLLPANTLFWKQRGNQIVLGIYVTARRWTVQTESNRYHLPMPPFVFVGEGRVYKIFAVKKWPVLSLPKRPVLSGDQDRKSKRPFAEQTHLYHAPCPNVHTTGSICQGNTPFPICTPQTIQDALHLFMEGSLFNADLSRNKCQSHADDVRLLWAELNGRKRFPLSELLPTQLMIRNLV